MEIITSLDAGTIFTFSYLSLLAMVAISIFLYISSGISERIDEFLQTWKRKGEWLAVFLVFTATISGAVFAVLETPKKNPYSQWGLRSQGLETQTLPRPNNDTTSAKHNLNIEKEALPSHNNPKKR
ncbi:MAG: hypothetical protein ABEI53_02705 [Candidatus Magasanikbacteria bacterium]